MVKVKTLVYGATMKVRLTKSDWIKHGLRTLADEGASALKVGPMSMRLEVSRGSFYWHFRDVAHFRSEILRSWQERTTDRVIREIEAEPDRLTQLMRRAFDGKLSENRTAGHDEWAAERAIRSWATYDASVATTVGSVDANRVDYIARLLVTAGVKPQRASARAVFMYWAYLGQAFMMDRRFSPIVDTAIDEISDLFGT